MASISNKRKYATYRKISPIEDTWNPIINKEFPEYSDFMARFVRRHRDRCRLLATQNRVLYRYTGILTILLGVLVPFLSASAFSESKTVLSLASLSLAAITGLRTFYNWEQRWQIYRTQDFALTIMVLEWELQVLEVIRTGGSDASARVEAITQSAARKAGSLIESEMSAFFNTISWPEATGSNGGQGS